VHDYFEILGVAPDADARDIREACARQAARRHADLFEAAQRSGEAPGDGGVDVRAFSRELLDAAVDFPEMSGLLDRVQAAFFRSPAA
jgi:curved DNA-binding protein CbpA